MPAAEQSPLADALAFTKEAQRTAAAANELGAAFDLRVVGKILEEDKKVHEQIEARSGTIADELSAILADGKVTEDELPRLEAIQKRAATVSHLAHC